MKQKIMILFLMICFLLAGCTGQQNDMISPPEALLEEYLANLEVLDTPNHEYGEISGYIQFEDELMVRILYPESTLPVLNDTIISWVEDIVSEYQTEANANSNHGDCAELSADYDSYLVNDNLVSIKITGLFDKPFLAHPIDIIATFHANLETGELITLDDLLLPNGRQALQNMVVKDAGLEAEVIDKALLNLWTLTADGLEIILKRGDYLPMSAGTVTLMYPLEELEGILTLAGNHSENGSEKPEAESPQESDSDALPPEDTIPSDPEGATPLPTIDPTKPMIALTFDDGPSKYTDRLLDAFASNGGKGTFFVVGNIIDNHPDTLKRIVSEGHQIGGHSWDHRQLTKLSREDITGQIMNTRAKILEITGADTTMIRPPYGSYNDDVKQVCTNLGIFMVNWSIDTLDWKHKDANKICDAILNDVQNGDIILCHDLYATTVDAMELVIPALIEKGYQLVTVSELLEYGGNDITAGNVYKKQ